MGSRKQLGSSSMGGFPFDSSECTVDSVQPLVACIRAKQLLMDSSSGDCSSERSSFKVYVVAEMVVNRLILNQLRILDIDGPEAFAAIQFFLVQAHFAHLHTYLKQGRYFFVSITH